MVERASRLQWIVVVVALSAFSGVADSNPGALVGSPAAKAPVDSKRLPPPPPRFGGVIAPNAAQSRPWWPPAATAPKGAPNILLIMTDDVGFGAPSTFGGVIPTPTLDRIAKMGLRYTAFHSTALCSPTRAALITGRNHHSAHSGAIAEQATGFPGYDSLIGKDTATLGEILKQNGYATAWFGKDHNVPTWEATSAGPFDRWPIGMGFDYFYGFLGGDTNQWEPALYRNTTPIQPYVGRPGWNLVTAMADDAIQYLRRLDQIEPDKPFFVYYVPGATHAPHHPTPEWIAKFKGQFDDGWNALRERIFANQKRLGVIAPNAKLTPWPDSLPKWDTLSADEKRLYAHQVEVYAAYLAYVDHEIGRVVDAVDQLGKLDNTLVIYISGDNGSSVEGTMHGTPNEVAVFNGVDVPVAEQLPLMDVWGSDKTYPHMAVPWSWAFDTPYKWTKQVASHLGGTRQGMTIAWPARIKDAGAVRAQFHHVVDIAPTILEACGIAQPDSVDGVTQKPMEGTSLVYTWDKANARAPSRHHTQYFEIMGNRAIYHDGWMASTTPPAPPWAMGLTKMPTDVMNGYAWELYDLDEDPTQADDLASKKPEKLREMRELFTVEATKYDVLPLDNSVVQRVLTPRPGPAAGRTQFVYTGVQPDIAPGAAPSLLDKSYTVTAEVTIPPGGAEGMLVTQGGRFGGYGMYLVKGRPVFTWDLLALERVRWEGREALAPGKHTVVFDFKYDGGGMGKGGMGKLSVDGHAVATKRMQRTVPFTLQIDEPFDVGVDSGTPVDDRDYQVPFRFTGTLDRLTVKLGPSAVAGAEPQHAMRD